MYEYQNVSVDVDNNCVGVTSLFIEGKLCIIEQNNDFVEEKNEVIVKTFDKHAIRAINNNKDTAAIDSYVTEGHVVGFWKMLDENDTLEENNFVRHNQWS